MDAVTCRAARQTESWVGQHHKAGWVSTTNWPVRHGRGARSLPLTFSLASHRGFGLSLTVTGAVVDSCTEQQQTAHGTRVLMLRIASAAALATWARRAGRGANDGPEGATPACLRDSASASSRAWRSVPSGTESTPRRRPAGTSNNVVPEPESSTSCSTAAPADSARTPSETTTASSCDESGPATWRTWSQWGWARQCRALAEGTEQGARQLAGARPHLL